MAKFRNRLIRMRHYTGTLRMEGVDISKKSLCLLITKFKKTEQGHARKLQECHYHFIDDAMVYNNEFISGQLYRLFKEAYLID